MILLKEGRKKITLKLLERNQTYRNWFASKYVDAYVDAAAPATSGWPEVFLDYKIEEKSLSSDDKELLGDCLAYYTSVDCDVSAAIREFKRLRKTPPDERDVGG